MFFKQFYLGCLAHASYLIGSEGEAAVVDPQRDVEQYLEEASRQHLTIKYVIETHLHADFVSGHRELANRTGATIVLGERARASFDHLPVKDGVEIRVGKVVLRIVETPGHTPESISVLVIDTDVSNEPQKVLTGDTLFIGDVGRPDLVATRLNKLERITAEALAGTLYDSLHQKLLSLPDEVEVHPAHGAGSLCGRSISGGTSSTIGNERRFNYALQPMPKEEFVQMMTTDLPEVPSYFSYDVELNRRGAVELESLPTPPALAPSEVKQLLKYSHIVLDTRSSEAFGAGHIPGSLHIALGGQFAFWSGTLIQMGTPILLVADDESRVDEAVTRLARVGLESVVGYLAGGLPAWAAAGEPISTVLQIPVSEARDLMQEQQKKMQVVDVRRTREFEEGHVPPAINLPLHQLRERLGKLDPSRPTLVICAGGYRSSAATSLLKRANFGEVYNIIGGTSAWRNAGYETVM